MALANTITSILNFLALMCSIPIITAGIWLASKPDNECIHWLSWPVVCMGFALLLVTLAGFVGAFWRKQTLLVVYLVFTAFVIVILFALIIFLFVVTRPGGEYSVPGRAYSEYRLGGFSSWLREHVTSLDNWGKIRACLADTDVCPNLNHKFVGGGDQFFAAHLTPIESGCCKPPTICGYQYVNPTVWTNPANPVADADCSVWNNDPSQLCYYCDSCKAGLLGNLRKEWRKANIILIVSIVVLIWVYLIGCSAFRNAQTEALFKRYKRGWV